MRFRIIALAVLLFAAGGFGSRAGAAPGATPAPAFFSPSEIITPDQIRPGMTGYGKSVFRGTKPETYGVTVISVLHNFPLQAEETEALLPEVVLVRVTSGPVVARKSGIIAGMSGSPVYIKGKLVGAIAFGFEFSKEPIAGVTPIRQMAEGFPIPSLSLRTADSGGLPAVTVTPGRLADSLSSGGKALVPEQGAIFVGGRKITRAEVRYLRPAKAPADKETMILTPVATPVMVSGLTPRAFKFLADKLAPYGFVAMPGGGRSSSLPPTRPVPGSSIGIQLAGGDVDISIFGTVTAIKGNKVLAMGHSVTGGSLLDLPMTNSYINDIIARQDWSFVMASGGAVIGRWTEDRPYALKGFLGEKAPTFPGKIAVTDAERGMKKQISVDFCDNRTFTPQIVGAVIQLAVESTALTQEGTLQTEFEVDAPGLAPLKKQNIYSPSPLQRSGLLALLFGGGSGSPAVDLSQITNTLMNNPYIPVTPKSISFSAQWSKESRAAEIVEVTSRQHRVRPGDTIDIELTLQPWKKPRETRTLQIPLPQNTPPGKLQVGIAGGSDIAMMKLALGIDDPTPVDLPGLMEEFRRENRNNQLLAEIVLGTNGLEAEGKQLFNLPQVMIEALSFTNGNNLQILHDHSPTLQELPYVLSGSSTLEFIVETDQKDKSGRLPMAPGRGGRGALGDSMMRGSASDSGGESGEMEARRPILSQDGSSSDGSDQQVDPQGPATPSLEELDAIESALDMTGDDAAAAASEGEEKASSPTLAPAGKSTLRAPQIWTDTAENDFTKGKTENTAVNSAGRVELAPPASEAYHAPEIIWPAAADKAGNFYLGTWFGGKVRKITPAGERVILDAKDTAITALACDALGNIYAAAAPSGAIWRIDPAGKSSLFGKVPAPYVWAMQLQSDNSLLAATGPEGKLFRLSPQGNCELVFAAPDRHIISLAAGPDGGVFFATYPKGKVYRLKDGKISPYYETPTQFTALSLATDKQGNLYVGTSPTAQVIVIDPQGKARLLYKSKEKHVFALWVAEDGTIYAATAPNARIYRISQNGDSALVWEDKLGFPVNLTDDGGNLFSTLADSRRVMTFNLKDAARGNYFSTVYDAGVPSRWGRLNWTADLKTGETVALETRSGSTAFPDATWSDWAAVANNTEGENIASPQSRYLQYRATLSPAPGAGSGPDLRQVQVLFMPLNRPPDLKLLNPAQESVWSGKKAIKWQATDPNKDSLSYQVFYSGNGGGAWTEIKEPEKPKKDTTPAKCDTPDKKGTKAADPPAAKDSGDKSDAAPGATPEGAPDGAAQSEEKPATKPTSRSWDTKTVADGTYLIKVVASDKLSNPKDPLSAEKISDPVTVDNAPPQILLEKSKSPGAPPAKVKVVEGNSYVASAEYRVDESDWKAAFCEDGIYDGAVEYVLIAAADLPAGEHALQVRARDGVGNEATEVMKYKKSE